MKDEGSRARGAGPFVVDTSVVFFVVPGVASNLCVARSIGSKMMLNKPKDVQERFA